MEAKYKKTKPCTWKTIDSRNVKRVKSGDYSNKRHENLIVVRDGKATRMCSQGCKRKDNPLANVKTITPTTQVRYHKRNGIVE